MSEEETQQQGSAPFNMALSTLEKLQKILVEIKKLSVLRQQHMKFFMVKELQVQSTPLISKKDGLDKMKEIKETLQKKITLQRDVERKRNGELIYNEIFDPNLDFILDDIVAEIQILLQNEGYFMPPKTDEALF